MKKKYIQLKTEVSIIAYLLFPLSLHHICCGWSVGRSVGRSVGWLVDWLNGWLFGTLA